MQILWKLPGVSSSSLSRKPRSETGISFWNFKVSDGMMICDDTRCFSDIELYIPGTQMTSIFEGQPPKTRPFPIKTRVIWVPGIYTVAFFLLSYLEHR